MACAVVLQWTGKPSHHETVCLLSHSASENNCVRPIYHQWEDLAKVAVSAIGWHFLHDLRPILSPHPLSQPLPIRCAAQSYDKSHAQ
jgi:hypothetical protein